MHLLTMHLLTVRIILPLNNRGSPRPGMAARRDHKATNGCPFQRTRIILSEPCPE